MNVSLYINLTAALLSAIVMLALYRIMPRIGWVETNFQGKTIPRSFGLVILIICPIAFAIRAHYDPVKCVHCASWILLLAGYGLLGLLDDSFGDKNVKGLRGHFRSTLLNGQITTGFVKAVGGAGLALWIAHALSPRDTLNMFIAAILIALSANALNLLDLRPGRALSVYLIFSCCLLLWGSVSRHQAPQSLVTLFLPASLLFYLDRKGLVMMGDTGSNLFGAALGLASAEILPVYVQFIIVLLLLGLHILAERISLSRLIEQVPLLRSLDGYTGIR